MIVNELITDKLVELISELPEEEISMLFLKSKLRKNEIEAGEKRLEFFDLLMNDLEVIPIICSKRYEISIEEFKSLDLDCKVGI